MGFVKSKDRSLGTATVVNVYHGYVDVQSGGSPQLMRALPVVGGTDDVSAGDTVLLSEKDGAIYAQSLAARSGNRDVVTGSGSGSGSGMSPHAMDYHTDECSWHAGLSGSCLHDPKDHTHTRYLKLDCSNDPLTASLEIQGNVNLNAAGAQVQIEGDHALSLEDGDGNRTNVSVGANALSGSGSDSVFVGEYAGNGATGGLDDVVAVGRYAGKDASLSDCVAIGQSCAQGGNIYQTEAIGEFAAQGYYIEQSVIIGGHAADYSGDHIVDSSVVIGEGAIEGTLDDDVDYCVVIGRNALHGTVQGQYSVAVGYSVAGGSDLTESVAIGRDAADDATLIDTVAIGPGAADSADVTGAVFIGHDCGQSVTTDNVLMIENSNDTSTPLVYGNFSAQTMKLHVNWLDLNLPAAEYRIEGDHALSLEDNDGNRTNVLLGASILASGSATDSIIGGQSAGANITITDSVVLGKEAASSNTNYGTYTIDDCVILGDRAANGLGGNMDDCIAIGKGALGRVGDWDYSTGTNVVAVGVYAGYEALLEDTVAVGDRSCYKSDCVDTTAIGPYAGYQCSSDGSVFIGHQAGNGVVTDNKLHIENSNSDGISTFPLIYGEFDNDIITLYADTAETAAIHDFFTLSHLTSGTAAALFGVSALHELEDAAGNSQTASEAATLWADATSGSESPIRRWTTYPAGSAGPGYAGFWTWDGVTDTSITVIPNGAGDVTGIIQINYAVLEVTGGGTSAGTANVTPGNTANIYTDGTDTLTVSVAADGSVTISRTAGSDTFQVSLLMNWV